MYLFYSRRVVWIPAGKVVRQQIVWVMQIVDLEIYTLRIKPYSNKNSSFYIIFFKLYI